MLFIPNTKGTPKVSLTNKKFFSINYHPSTWDRKLEAWKRTLINRRALLINQDDTHEKGIQAGITGRKLRKQG